MFPFQDIKKIVKNNHSMLTTATATTAEIVAELKLSRSLDFTKFGCGLSNMLEVLKFDYLDDRFDAWISNHQIQKGIIVFITSRVTPVANIVDYSIAVLKELHSTLFTPNVISRLCYGDSIK
jgi:hypothetical protein